MNRLSNYYRSLLLFLITAFFSAGAYAQDCSIVPDQDLTKGGCVPFFFTVSANTDPSKSVQSVLWDFGNGSTSNKNPAIFAYNNRGTYVITLTVKYTDGSTCTKTLSNVKVFGKPTANASLAPNISVKQCLKSVNSENKFCFLDKSLIGPEGAAIVRYRWNFGDGNVDSVNKNPCHTYEAEGNYKLLLEVWDANGCYDSVVFPQPIVVLPEIKVKFNATGVQSCDSSIYSFINPLDTNGLFITRWYWDFGDGSARDSVNYGTLAKPVKHTYKAPQDQEFEAELHIFNILGCESVFKTKVKHTAAEIKVLYKDTMCWAEATGNGMAFSAKEMVGATNIIWNFDDPASGPPNNIRRGSWKETHKFMGGPKIYKVKFSFYMPACKKQFDTCINVHIQGPQAAITMSEPIPMVTPVNNDFIPARPMPKAEFDMVNSGMRGCKLFDKDSLEYSKFVKVNRTVTENKYCNAPVLASFLDSIELCKPKDNQYFTSRVILSPTNTVTRTYEDSVETIYFYKKGNPIPAAPYYYPSTGQKLVQNMHDSNLFSCTLPNLVRFTNHSIKYRLYEALDNNPVAYADSTWPSAVDTSIRVFVNGVLSYKPIRYFNWTFPIQAVPTELVPNGWMDTCRNPNYPFASDSLTYLWKFRDPVGDDCTSSVALKNWNCNFSTLVAPYHNYRRDTNATKPPIWAVYDNGKFVSKNVLDLGIDTLRYLNQIYNFAPADYFKMGATQLNTLANTNKRNGYFVDLQDTLPLYWGTPQNGCFTVELTVKDSITGCQDSMQLQLRHTPPNAWWDRGAFCKMTWEIQTFNSQTGSFNNPNKPLRGFIMKGQQSCAGDQYKFDINFTETLPSCGPQDYWIVFDSAAAVKICTGADGKKFKNYGFIPPLGQSTTNNAKGYPVGGPMSVWTNPMTWKTQYWYQLGDEGCKTVGVVVKNGQCFDTAWYHDYLCLTRITAEFNVYQYDTTWFVDENDDTTYKVNYLKKDSSYSVTSQASKTIYCKSSKKPGITIALLPNDREMQGVTQFDFSITRREFPGGDYYYTKEHAGSILRGFWPDTAVINPFNLRNPQVDTINPISQYVTGGVTSYQDKIYYLKGDTAIFRPIYDNNNVIVDTLAISGMPITEKEFDELNAKGVTYLPTNDFRSRILASECGVDSVEIRAKRLPLIVRRNGYFLKLKDSAMDDVTYLKDLQGNDSAAIHDTFRITLPYPGFYTIQSASNNIQGCQQNSIYHLIHGHFARFNVKGGDSIVCAGTKVEFDFMVRYWTTECPPIPGSPAPPPGCINGVIDNGFGPYGGVLTAWDSDPKILRQALLPAWTESPGRIREKVEWNFGENLGARYTFPYGTTPNYTYSKPGIYDVTMITTDSNGCEIRTVRRNLIKVIQVEADFAISPISDTLVICPRLSVQVRDKTRFLKTELDNPRKFGYKDPVLKYDQNTRKYYVDTIDQVLDSVISWTWDPGNGVDPIKRTNTDSLELFYQRYGTYSVGLEVETSNQPVACEGSLTKKDYVTLLGPIPNFELLDTAGCMPYTININVLNDSADAYVWNAENVVTKQTETWSSVEGESVVSYTLEKPGRYRIYVSQQQTITNPITGDEVSCAATWPDTLKGDTIEFYVTVYPYGTFTLTGDTAVCIGEVANFTASGQYGEYDTLIFTYGNGQSIKGSDSTVSTSYADSGTYQVIVQGITKYNCVQYDTLTVRVQGVNAEIEVDAEKSDSDIGKFVFNNKSSNGVKYIWDFGDNTTPIQVQNNQPITHDYSNFPEPNVPEGDAGKSQKFKVRLVTFSEYGCTDTAYVDVEIPSKWNRRNILTPNGDGSNDVFNPLIEGEVSYELEIYNRWGERVFETKDSEDDWNGKINNTGAECPEGTYFYVWKFKLVGGFENTVNGTVTLIR